MISSNPKAGVRTKCAYSERSGLRASKLRIRVGEYLSAVSTASALENPLEALKHSSGSLLGIPRFSGLFDTRTFAQKLRVARVGVSSLLTQKFGFGSDSPIVSIAPAMEDALEGLSSNLVALFAPSSVTLHSIEYGTVLTHLPIRVEAIGFTPNRVDIERSGLSRPPDRGDDHDSNQD